VSFSGENQDKEIQPVMGGLENSRRAEVDAPRLNRGTWRGLESQSGFVRAASSRA
jgi:hypothetical protein